MGRRATGTDGFPTVGNGVECVGGSTADTGNRTEPMRAYLFTSPLALQCTAFAVVAVADAAATVVETTVDVAAAGINTVVRGSDERKQ